MTAKENLGWLKFIVIVMGIVLMAGMGFVGTALIKQSSQFDDKNAAQSKACAATEEIRIRNRGTVESITVEQDIVRLITKRSDDSHHLIRIDLCDAKVLSDTRLILEDTENKASAQP